MLPTKTRFLRLLELQDILNAKIHPQWRSQNYPFYRATLKECSELTDHCAWKWWSDTQTNLAQVQLEVVDILHTGMSMMLQEHSLDTAADMLVKSFSTEQLVSPYLEKPEKIMIATEGLILDVLKTHKFPLSRFWGLVAVTDLSFESLYVKYIGKNVLNHFRQDHGYSKTDAKYIKIWDGREDNEHLTDVLGLLDPNSENFEKDIYDQLEHIYLNLSPPN